jgi:hypothetical protein
LEEQEEDMAVGGRIKIKASWVREVLVLNLSQNYIKDAGILTQIFPNIKELYSLEKSNILNKIHTHNKKPKNPRSVPKLNKINPTRIKHIKQP